MASSEILPPSVRRRREEEPLLLVGARGDRVRLIHSTRSVMELTPDQAEALAGKLFEAAVRIRTGWSASAGGYDQER